MADHFTRRYGDRRGAQIRHILLLSGGAADATPRIVMAGTSIAEDAAGDAEIGTASVANAPEGVTYTWAITSDPDSKFAIVEATGVLSLATLATLDYETATSHEVTIEATPSAGDPPPPRTFTISVTNVIEAPVNVTPPAVTGTVEVGSTLTCSTGTWTDMGAGSFAYQWKDAADDSDIVGATSSTLLLAREHATLELYCTVTATNSADSTAEDSNTVGPVPAIVPDAFVIADWDLDAGDEEADVTINSLPDDGGDTITDVEYRLDSGSWVSSGGTTSFTITGLTNDQEYDVELRAVNSVGAGAASDVKQVTPEDASFDPSDLGVKRLADWDFIDTAHLWQNSNGTGAVASDTDPVGRVDDLSGNGKHIIQATAGNRPAYRTGPARVRFDGVNDRLSVATPAFPLTAFELYVVMEDYSSNGDNSAFLCFAPASGNDWTSLGAMIFSNGISTSQIRVEMSNQTLTVDWAGSGLAGFGLYSLIKAAATCALAKNNGTAATDNSFTATDATHAGDFFVGCRFYSSVPNSHKAVDMRRIIITSPLTTEERDSLKAYLYARYGITP